MNLFQQRDLVADTQNIAIAFDADDALAR